MPENVVEAHVVFSGRVQGVGFRATAQHLAHQMGIVGTVRNHHDGTVDMYAHGSKEQIEQFIKRLKDYLHLEEDNIKVAFQDKSSKRFTSFEII